MRFRQASDGRGPPTDHDAARAGSGTGLHVRKRGRNGALDPQRLSPSPPSVTFYSVFLSLCQLFCRTLIIFSLKDCCGASMSSQKHFINTKTVWQLLRKFRKSRERNYPMVLYNPGKHQREREKDLKYWLPTLGCTLESSGEFLKNKTRVLATEHGCHRCD